MNEATIQTIVMHAMKEICRESNIRMRLHVSAANEQSPVAPDGRPYDVGVLFDGAYLVGLEFKALRDGQFPSWNDEQHRTYLGLTASERVGLPLFYAYNAVDTKELNDRYEESQFASLLRGANISTPKALPGRRPAVLAHENMYEWLVALLADPARATRNGWTTIFVGDVMILDDVLTAYPNLIWLLVVAHDGLKISWALTGKELRSHVSNLRQIWMNRDLRRLTKRDDVEAAYVSAVAELMDYMETVQRDVEDQQQNEQDMEDRPATDFPTFGF